MITTSKKTGSFPSTLIFNMQNKAKTVPDQIFSKNDKSSFSREDAHKKNDDPQSQPYPKIKFGIDLFNENRNKWTEVFFNKNFLSLFIYLFCKAHNFIFIS